MKRLSLFAALLFVAAMSFAQAAITFTAVSAKGTLIDSTFAASNLTLQTVDPESKMQIDANAANFSVDGTNPFACTHRLKSGGKTDANVTKNYLKLTAAKAGTLYIGVRTGSNDATDRTLVIKQGANELYNQAITEAMKDSVVGETTVYYYHPVVVEVEAGELILSYPVNGLNFYYFMLEEAAQLKTIATVEKLWSRTVADIGSTLADSRQGAGYNGVLYVLNKINHSLVAITETAKDTIINGNIYVRTDTTINGTMTITKRDSSLVDNVWVYEYDTTYSDKYEDVYIKLDGTAYAMDDAGNFVMEGTFPNVPSHLVVRKADGSAVYDLPIQGLTRTDFINATGDVFSDNGGYVFVYGNSASGLLIYKIANGAIVNTTTVDVAGASGGNYVIKGDETTQIAHHRTSENGWVLIQNGVASTIENMEGFKKSTLGGDIITVAGKEFYIYPAGATNYNSQFSVRNMTDGIMVADKADPTSTIFFANDITKAGGASSTACWINATPIDDNNAYIHVYNAADGVALFKLNVAVAAEVTVSCDTLQGSVIGGGDFAVGANATVVATPKPGYEFVAWKKGEQVVSTDASYTFVASGNIALTAIFEAKENVTITLAVNDANLGSITLPDGIVMGANSVVYGTPITLTAVPVLGKTLAGWYNGEELYSTNPQIILDGKESLSLTAKFVNVLVISYELNGGVTNDYGWMNLQELYEGMNADYNQFSGSTKTWKPLDQIARGQESTGFATSVTVDPTPFFMDATYSPKWKWMYDYIDGVWRAFWTAHQTELANMGASFDPETSVMTAVQVRYNISHFFPAGEGTLSSFYTGAADFTMAGMYEAWQPAWKHAYANPTQIMAEVTLNAPYKEGSTFDGWYATADFSGEKITKVGPESNIPGGKLYAKWIEYIATIKEAIETEKGTAVRTAGVVNHVDGKKVYIQDASGAVLVFMKEAANCHVDDYIVVTGNNTVYDGAPEIEQGEIVSTETGHSVPAETTAALGALKADVLTYFAKRIKVEGLVISSYDSNGNTFVTDGTDTVQCYKVAADQQAFPVGTRVNVHLVGATYKGNFQFVGSASGIEKAKLTAEDPYVYPARGENNEYTLTNKWLICDNMDNYSANRPAAKDKCRGMAAKDGKMYFVNSANGSFTVVDGETGAMLPSLMITGDHLFQHPDSAGEWKDAVTYGYNDVKFDNAGHCLITGCASGGQRVMVYVVDLATGAATELINERLLDNPEFAEDSWRMDAIGVYGDVTDHAIVMFGNSMNKSLNAAYKWEINGGVVSPAERIDLVVDDADETYMINSDGTVVAEDYSACQVFPVDEDYFYWDHHSCRPTLFTMDGTFAYDLKSCPTKTTVWNTETDSCMVGAGHNGICEFQVGDDYFVIMAATNNVEKPASSFALFKFADASKDFSGMTPLWYFPAGGMGGQQNSYRTAVPTVEVKDDVATIYLYAGENGYGVYELKGVASGINNVDADVTVQKVMRNGQLYIIKNGVEYSVLGVQVK